MCGRRARSNGSYRVRSFAFQTTTVGLLSLGLITMSSCAGGGKGSTGSGSGTPPPPPPAAATNIYVVASNRFLTGQLDTPPIVQFSTAASGSVTPAVTLPSPAGVEFVSVATDSEGQLYVGAVTFTGPTTKAVVTGYEVLVYAAGVTATSTPVRTILISGATTTYPRAIAVDPTGQVYVVLVSANGTTADIAVYSSTASGAATPVRTINTQLVSKVYQLAVDSSNNLYAAGVASPDNGVNGVIAVFGPTATGSATPIIQITGTNVGPLNSLGVAVDSSGHIYAVDSTNNGTIYEFAAGANGTPTPLKTITVPASTGLGSLLDLAVDPVGNVFVEGGGTVGIARYASNATGAEAPLNVFTSPVLNLSVEVSYAIH